MRIGNVELVVVSDGAFMMDGGAVFGVVPKVLWQRVVHPDELNRVPLSLNCLLIRSRGKNILVETGIGGKLAPRVQENFGVQRGDGLLADLGRAGLAPEDVDIVINTHLHFDHCGGNTVVHNGEMVPAFPRAEYWVQRGEWEDAVRPNERTRATYLEENLLPLEGHGRLRLVDGDAAVTDEVRCVLAPGHTRHHQVVLVESEGRSALCVGDLAQIWVQLERLAWISAFDVEPLVSLESKRRLLTEAAARHTLVIPIHSDRLGYVEQHEQGFRIVPAAPDR